MARSVDARVPNRELVALREAAGLSQQDLADELNAVARSGFDRRVDLTKKTVGRWERGEVDWPHPFYRRLLAAYFSVAADELGFHRPRPSGPALVRRLDAEPEGLPPVVPPPNDPQVVADQRTWRQHRAALGERRRALAVLAEDLYPEHRLPGAEHTGVITTPGWLPDHPVPLGQVVLDRLADECAAPVVTGTERESAGVRPLATVDRRYRRYSHAVRDLAAPALFENRLCFRLLGIDWAAPARQLAFGPTGFFDAIDTNEALAHETAAIAADGGRVGWPRLPFRTLVGDPFDVSRRALMGAIGTLTLRGGDDPTLLLHQRDGARVAGGGGMVHLLPAGVFQPSSVRPDCVARDFSLWRTVQREYAEELLGHDDCDGTAGPCDYATEPFATLDAALADGRLRAHCLGVTLDALTLATDILTVVVLDPPLYDEVFAAAVASNDEGTTHTVPFDGGTLRRLRESERLAPGAAAALHLAWRSRRSLLPA